MNKFITKSTKQLTTRSYIIGELFAFLWQEKLWWMIPLVFLLVIVGALILFAQSSPIAPFLYTIF